MNESNAIRYEQLFIDLLYVCKISNMRKGAYILSACAGIDAIFLIRRILTEMLLRLPVMFLPLLMMLNRLFR